MTPASKSIYYFGFYLLLTGVVLTVVPNVLLSMMQMEETKEVWIRVLGIVVSNVALFYIFMAPSNSTLFQSLTVYGRALVLGWFILFVLIGWAHAQLILFGLIDAAGATWTYTALRKQLRAA